METDIVLFLEPCSCDCSYQIVMNFRIVESIRKERKTFQLKLHVMDSVFVEVPHDYLESEALQNVVEHHLLKIFIHRDLKLSHVSTSVFGILV